MKRFLAPIALSIAVAGGASACNPAPTPTNDNPGWVATAIWRDSGRSGSCSAVGATRRIGNEWRTEVRCDLQAATLRQWDGGDTVLVGANGAFIGWY